MSVSFPNEDRGKTKQSPLSQLMIASLLALYAKQKDRIPFVSKDGRGSFVTLVSRGLIVSRHIIVNAQAQLIWEVTDEAIEMLKASGIEVPV